MNNRPIKQNRTEGPTTAINNRNMVAQIVTLKDGSTKKVFHKKAFQNNDRPSYWKQLNSTPVNERPFNSRITGQVPIEQQIMRRN